MGDFLKFGHRGARGLVPENTLQAFRWAHAWNLDGIEFDVRSSRDGAIVVFHDDTLSRMIPGASGRIRDHDLAALKEFRIGSEQIPTLVEVCREFGDKLILNIELKEKDLADRVLDIVRSLGLEERVIVSAFARDENDPGSDSSWQDLFWLNSRCPKTKIGLIVGSAGWIPAAVLAAGSEHFPVYSIHAQKDQLTADSVKMIRERSGCRIFAWTTNDQLEAARLAVLGIDGIFTDHPDALSNSGWGTGE